MDRPGLLAQDLHLRGLFGLTLIAVAWVTSYLRIGARARSVLLGLFAADCVLEVGGVLLVVVLSTFAIASFRHRPEGPAGRSLALRTSCSPAPTEAALAVRREERILDPGGDRALRPQLRVRDRAGREVDDID